MQLSTRKMTREEKRNTQVSEDAQRVLMRKDLKIIFKSMQDLMLKSMPAFFILKEIYCGLIECHRQI